MNLYEHLLGDISWDNFTEHVGTMAEIARDFVVENTVGTEQPVAPEEWQVQEALERIRNSRSRIAQMRNTEVTESGWDLLRSSPKVQSEPRMYLMGDEIEMVEQTRNETFLQRALEDEEFKMPDEMTVEQRINLLEEAHEVIDELHEYEQENDLRQLVSREIPESELAPTKFIRYGDEWLQRQEVFLEPKEMLENKVIPYEDYSEGINNFDPERMQDLMEPEMELVRLNMDEPEDVPNDTLRQFDELIADEPPVENTQELDDIMDDFDDVYISEDDPLFDDPLLDNISDVGDDYIGDDDPLLDVLNPEEIELQPLNVEPYVAEPRLAPFDGIEQPLLGELNEVAAGGWNTVAKYAGPIGLGLSLGTYGITKLIQANEKKHSTRNAQKVVIIVMNYVWYPAFIIWETKRTYFVEFKDLTSYIRRLEIGAQLVTYVKPTQTFISWNSMNILPSMIQDNNHYTQGGQQNIQTLKYLPLLLEGQTVRFRGKKGIVKRPMKQTFEPEENDDKYLILFEDKSEQFLSALELQVLDEKTNSKLRKQKEETLERMQRYPKLPPQWVNPLNEEEPYFETKPFTYSFDPFDNHWTLATNVDRYGQSIDPMLDELKKYLDAVIEGGLYYFTPSSHANPYDKNDEYFSKRDDFKFTKEWDYVGLEPVIHNRYMEMLKTDYFEATPIVNEGKITKKRGMIHDIVDKTPKQIYQEKLERIRQAKEDSLYPEEINVNILEDLKEDFDESFFIPKKDKVKKIKEPDISDYYLPTKDKTPVEDIIVSRRLMQNPAVSLPGFYDINPNYIAFVKDLEGRKYVVQGNEQRVIMYSKVIASANWDFSPLALFIHNFKKIRPFNLAFKNAMNLKRTKQITKYDTASVAAGFGAIYKYKVFMGQRVAASKIRVPSFNKTKKMIDGRFVDPKAPKSYEYADPTVREPRFPIEQTFWHYKAQLFQVIMEENKVRTGLFWSLDEVLTKLMEEMVPAHNYVTAIELGHKEAQKRYNFICLFEYVNDEYFEMEVDKLPYFEHLTYQKRDLERSYENTLITPDIELKVARKSISEEEYNNKRGPDGLNFRFESGSIGKEKHFALSQKIQISEILDQHVSVYPDEWHEMVNNVLAIKKVDITEKIKAYRFMNVTKEVFEIWEPLQERFPKQYWKYLSGDEELKVIPDAHIERFLMLLNRNVKKYRDEWPKYVEIKNKKYEPMWNFISKTFDPALASVNEKYKTNYMPKQLFTMKQYKHGGAAQKPASGAMQLRTIGKRNQLELKKYLGLVDDNAFRIFLNETMNTERKPVKKTEWSKGTKDMWVNVTALLEIEMIHNQLVISEVSKEIKLENNEWSVEFLQEKLDDKTAAAVAFRILDAQPTISEKPEIPDTASESEQSDSESANEPRRSERLKEKENLAVYKEENLGLQHGVNVHVKDEYNQNPDPLIAPVINPPENEPNFVQDTDVLPRPVKIESPAESPVLFQRVAPYNLPNLDVSDDIEIFASGRKRSIDSMDAEPFQLQHYPSNLYANVSDTHLSERESYENSYHSYVFPVFLGFILITFVSQMD